MQSIEEHYEKIEKGICPLCGSEEPFEEITVGYGTEHEDTSIYCSVCMIKLV